MRQFRFDFDWRVLIYSAHSLISLSNSQSDAMAMRFNSIFTFVHFDSVFELLDERYLIWRRRRRKKNNTKKQIRYKVHKTDRLYGSKRWDELSWILVELNAKTCYWTRKNVKEFGTEWGESICRNTLYV